MPSVAPDYAKTLFDELTGQTRTAAEKWARVVQLCTDGEEESLQLDFKGITQPCPDPAKEVYIVDKFARALSGFANVAGGIVIYGIEMSQQAPRNEPDRAARIGHIPSVAAFRASMEKLASLVVEPVIAGVNIRHVEDPSRPSEGVVVVYVPESYGGPHRVARMQRTLGVTHDRYYMRTTTEMQSMPHSTLADRFARVARPRLCLAATLVSGAPGLNVKIRNTGGGVAVQPAIRFVKIDNKLDWHRLTAMGPHWSIMYPRGISTPGEIVYVSEPSVVIYPGVDVTPIHLPARGGGIVGVHVEGEIFCRESPSVRFEGALVPDVETVLPAEH